MAPEACNPRVAFRRAVLAACVLPFIAFPVYATTKHETNSLDVEGFEEGELVKRPAAEPELLVPWQTVTGGQLVTAIDVNGFPVPGAMRGFAALVAPSALAVRGTDLYVADSGARKLYRIDTIAQVMSVVPGVVSMSWTQMQVGSDLSLYVLDPMQREILHFTRGMQPLQTLGDSSSTASLNGFVVDVPLGQIVASDKISQRLVMFSPLGGSALLMGSSGEGEFRALGALASDGRTVYAVDGACFCIAVMDEVGRVKKRIGQGLLTQPQALAADRHGHIFVSDAADRTLKVFFHGQLIADYQAQALRLIEITALAVDEDMLYVADGAGSKVLSFRIQTPARGR